MSLDSVPPRVSGLIREVARWHDIEPEEIIGRSRRRKIVQARGDAVRLVRALGSYRLKQIGYWFGDRRHNTINVYRSER